VVLVLLLPVPWLHVVSDDPPGTAWRLDGRLEVNGNTVDPEGEWTWLAVGRPQLVGEVLWEEAFGTTDPADDLRAGPITRSPALSEPSAAAVGLRQAGRDVPLGLLVEVREPLVEGLPQSGVIASINGVQVTDRHTWKRATGNWGVDVRIREPYGATAYKPEVDQSVTFGLADGRRFTTPGHDLPYEFVHMLDLAPEDLTAGISFVSADWLPVDWFRELSLGSSHGSMVALTTYAQASGRDLSQGRHIAGTGAIAGDGAYVRIGGLPSKARAAHRSGADVLLFPASQEAELEGMDLDGMTLVPVRNLEEAVEWLARPVT
jgi:hypothetical protein